LRTPVPAIPTALPDVEVITTARRATPLAVVCRAGDAAPSSLSVRGDELTDDWMRAVALTGRAGEVQPGPAGSSVRWVAGVGDGAPGQWRTAGAALTKALNARIAKDTDAGRTAERTLQLELPDSVGPDEVTELVCGLRLGGYRFAVTADEAPSAVRAIRLVTSDAALDETVRRAAVLAQATALARDLANTPSNVKDPAWLATMATRTAGKVADVVVRDEKWLAAQGFGGVLAVGGGSTRPPRFVELSWRPAKAKAHIVLVGKGITFDTGGISLKPADGMHLMRTDMSGGAAVIAAVEAIARLGLDVRVTGLVPSAENHVSGSAYRPGDVVRHYGGRTTEVTNTDAEGRMVMADALAYAHTTLKPDLLVDVATLTGAMKVSLGLRTGGVFASSDEVAATVLAAGAAAGERWWRMPLGSDLGSVAEEFAESVRSEIADVRQCPPGPGGIAAAMFLREFTGGLPWAHLDIAGPARADRNYDEVTAGATGFAARTLVELVAGFRSRPA
jgi:leucyl aminopeptidase